MRWTARTWQRSLDELTDGRQDVIGRGTWIDKLAHEMVEREEGLGRSTDMLRVESGLGASGIPHIGSIGDAVRAFGVKLALEDMGHGSELVAYSDDLDGLRKIPDGMPASLEEHMARPVSAIPDPDGCHDSYGMHMSSLLLDGLDRIGVEYRFERARDAYGRGEFAEQIHRILSERGRIGERISEMVGQEKYTRYLPYHPVCAGCGRLYTAEAHDYLEDSRRVRYRCGDAKIGESVVRGCGHEGEADISGAGGKLAWKVEFAARWQALDIRFEAYGKDIMDSVRVNDWVADEVLGFAHPHHVKYEMFLDKGGKKISKSAGNVVTAQRWFRYGSPRSVLLLLYKRITGARELGFDDIPALMDEYNELEDVYFGRAKIDNPARAARLRGLYEYVNLLDPPAGAAPHVSYRLAAELAGIFVEDRVDRVTKKLADYGVIGEEDAQSLAVRELVGLAGNYADDFGGGGGGGGDGGAEIGKEVRAALAGVADMLEGTEDPADLQNSIYQAAKSNGAAPRDLFRALYRIILGTDRGPKIGPFILDVGRGKVGRMIRAWLG